MTEKQKSEIETLIENLKRKAYSPNDYISRNADAESRGIDYALRVMGYKINYATCKIEEIAEKQ